MSKFPSAAADSAQRFSLLAASCWLALFLVVAKAVTWEAAWWPHLARRLLIVVTTSWRDVLFALACGMTAELLALSVRRQAALAKYVRGAVLVFFAICAGYAIAAIGVFRYFNRPLTFQMFGLIENAGAIRSSVLERVTLSIGTGVLLVPALFLALTTKLRASRGTALSAVVFWSVWMMSGWALYREPTDDKQSAQLVLNPHTELLRTTARRLFTGRRPNLPKDFPPEFTAEFHTFAARAPENTSHFILPEGTARPKNAIVIVLESVGTKYLALYGNPHEVTPALTAEAQHALVFDNIYAHASFTYASFRPINFSVYPGLPWHYSLLEDARPLPATLASVMKTRGSRTAYITSGDLDWGDQRWLLTRQSNFDLLAGAADLGCPLLSSWGAEDRCAVDRLLRWIDEKPGQPFFAVCWTDQTHDPFLPSPGSSPAEMFAGQKRPAFAEDLSRFLTNLHNADAQLARIFAALRERGLADDTLVVVTGDHGEAFADPHSQRGHAFSVYEEEVKVPLLIWNPRLFATGARSPVIGGHVDLNPTLADLLGVEPAREWQGHSLFDPERPARAFLMAIATGDVFGVREENWKYVFDVTSGRESLFDLASDPREQQDRAAGELERARALRERMAAWVSFEDAYLWGREN